MILSICCRQQLSEVFTCFHTVLVLTAELVVSFYDYTACGKLLQSRNQTKPQEIIPQASDYVKVLKYVKSEAFLHTAE